MNGTWIAFGVIWGDSMYKMWAIGSNDKSSIVAMCNCTLQPKGKLQECMGCVCWCAMPNCHSRVEVSSLTIVF